MVAAVEVVPRLAAEVVAADPNREAADSFDMGNSVPADMGSAVVADTEVVDIAAVVEAEADIEVAVVGLAALAIVNPCRNYRKISRLQLKEHRTWGMEPSVA